MNKQEPAMNDRSCEPETSCKCGTSKTQYILTAVLILAGLFYFAAARTGASAGGDMPGLVIYNGMGLGGLGRLHYDEDRRAYTLLDGRFTPFVVDGDTVRPMRIDESGGTMATPEEIASIDGAIYGFLPGYNAVMRINPDSTIDRLGRYGDFTYTGGNQHRMDAHNGNLFFFKNNRLIAFSPALEKLGELEIAHIRRPHDNYVIADNRLYYFESEDTAPYTDCVFIQPKDENPPADRRCGERYSRMAVVDISDPRNMRVINNEKRDDESPARFSEFTGFDAEQGHWLLAAGRDGMFQLRKADSFAQIADTLEYKGTIRAMTRAAPFYVLRWNGKRMVINAISTTGGKIGMGPDFETGLAGDYEGAVMKRKGDLLFITARSYLRVVRTGKAPEVVMMQDFQDDRGDRFQFENFAFADDLPAPDPNADRARLTGILKMDMIDRARMIELQSEIDKLTPEDAWAVEPLADILRKQGTFVHMYPLAAEGLGNLGETAVPAIPALLDAGMIGAGIRGDYVPHLAAALKKIDPEGTHVVAALPAFIADNYTAGAKSVAKRVLTALPGDAAQEALSKYK